MALSGASQAMALDRFQVEGYELANGLQVILKPGNDRGHVAIRLVVDVGFDDFPCADQELPHLLEHLLFSGLDDSGEGGLEQRMQALGGEWNAFTSSSDTTFVIEAPARNQRKVLDLLRDIITKTNIDAKALELSRQIVEHEDGGHYSHLQRLLDRQDLGHGAIDQLATELGLKCTERATAADLTLAQVLAVRKKWYVANNMSLIIVGDLDRLLPAYLERSYGDLPAAELEDSEQPLLSISHVAEARRTLPEGWLGDGAQLHWFYLEPAAASDPPEALDLVQGYLDWALYTELRLKHGLSYGPWSQRDAFGDTGILSLNADVDRDDITEANTVLGQLMDNLREHGLDPDTFERLKQQTLARQAWAVEGDSALADYYWNNLGDYDAGRFDDPARGIRAVTLAQANQALRQVLQKPPYIRVEQPLLSYDMLYTLLAASAGVLLLIVLALLWAWRACRRQRRAAVPPAAGAA
ncbi:pitrilysin family protein [Pseudomonas sp. HR96]|uniref:M16 family metallopeptidase n=1 Tax=Pseudomonas sp. HR96 TaxID=1027966 RepID=UPI002A750FEB|nr:pitrilysin family protein [Pseudomonas sp. HR96]WPP02338.1 pitrilysin family protein [Pseudomonas sp. HR96]